MTRGSKCCWRQQVQIAAGGSRFKLLLDEKENAQMKITEASH